MNFSRKMLKGIYQLWDTDYRLKTNARKILTWIGAPKKNGVKFTTLIILPMVTLNEEVLCIIGNIKSDEKGVFKAPGGRASA